MSKSIHIILVEAEEKMVNRLIKERGYRQSDVVRMGIRKMYEKEFPKYLDETVAGQTQAKVKKNKAGKPIGLTPEQYCIDFLGGEVVERDGERYCKIVKGALQSLTPLKNYE